MNTENMDQDKLVEEEIEVAGTNLKNGTHVESIYIVVGTRVKRYRKRRHLTIQQVSDRAGVSYGSIVKLENAHSRTRLDVIEKIAKVLKVDLKTLVG